MNTKSESFTPEVTWANPLPTWWRTSNTGGVNNVESQMERFQILAYDLQKAFGEAFSQQTGTRLTANLRLADLLQQFMNCRQPQEALAIGSDVLATFLEDASAQAKTWADLTQKVQECCAAMARGTATKTRESPETETEKKSARRPAYMSDGVAKRSQARV